MTTDTFPKVATRRVRIGGGEIVLVGMAKGAGMIAPDMATMLSFVFTDAPIGPAALQTCLNAAVEKSFNAVTIDGDTSTSDTLLAFATGAAAAHGVPALDESGEALAKFQAALIRSLPRSRAAGGARRRGADEIRRDRRHRRGVRRLRPKDRALDRQFAAGEDGARRRGRQLGPRRDGGRQGRRARRPRPPRHLVRRAPRRLRRRARSGLFGGGGLRLHEERRARIRVDLGLGQGSATIWTCDLTAEYIAINADYRS